MFDKALNINKTEHNFYNQLKIGSSLCKSCKVHVMNPNLCAKGELNSIDKRIQYNVTNISYGILSHTIV